MIIQLFYAINVAISTSCCAMFDFYKKTGKRRFASTRCLQIVPLVDVIHVVIIAIAHELARADALLVAFMLDHVR